MVRGECPYNNQLVQFDFGLNSRGDEEDTTFALNEELRLNVRRGNSIMIILD